MQPEFRFIMDNSTFEIDIKSEVVIFLLFRKKQTKCISVAVVSLSKVCRFLT